MFPSSEDKGISPSLEAAEKRSRAVAFSTRLPNSSSNGTSDEEGSKSTKVKSGTTKASRSGSESTAEKGLHFTSFSLKREFLSSLFLISKKDGDYRSVISLQFRFLQQQQIILLKQTQSYLALVKLIPVVKNELLWSVSNMEFCNSQLFMQPQAQIFIQTDASNKGWGAVCRGI